MELAISMGPGGELLDILNSGFREADSLGIAVAYMTGGGFGKIEESLEVALAGEGSVQIAHAADGAVTEPAVIRSLRNWNSRYPRMTYRVQFNRRMADVPLFHPKIYWYERSDRTTTCVIGSSNLTASGLTRNIEANAIISGTRDSEPIRNCRAAFDLLFGGKDLFEPSDAFLQLYEQIHDREKHQLVLRQRNNELSNLYEAIGDQIAEERKQNEPAGWKPKTQLDVIVLALQRNVTNAELHLDEIYVRARQIADEFGLEYDWSTWKNSVRGRINVNTVGKVGGGKLFERIGGEDSKSGIYGLSVAGRNYLGKL